MASSSTTSTPSSTKAAAAGDEDLDLPPNNDAVMDRAEAALQLSKAHLEIN
nr:exocyst complex component EXO70B1 [Ipomoea batatas]